MFTGSSGQDDNCWQWSQRHLRVQYAIVSVLANSVDLQIASNRVLQIICQHMGWDVGVIWRVDKDEGALICLHVFHEEGFDVHEFAQSCRKFKYAKGQGMPGKVWQEQTHVWSNDVTQESGFLRMHSADRYGLHSAFGFPIIIANEVIGVIEFFSRDMKQLDNDLLDLLQATSVQLGQFIERLVAQQALKEAQVALTDNLHQQMAVAELGRSALVGEDLDVLFKEAATKVVSLMNVDYLTIMQLLPSGRSLVVKASVGFDQGLAGQAAVSAGKESLAGYTLILDQCVLVEDLAQETRFKTSFMREHGATSAMSAVIKGHDSPYGVVAVYSKSKRQFNDNEITFLKAAANVLGSAIARKRVEETEQRTLLLEQREDFTVTLTHDLKGPLLGVNRIVELVADGKLGDVNDQQRSLLLQIIKTNKGLLSLIQDMLDVFRYEKDIHALSLVQTDVREIIKNSVAELSPLAVNRGIDIKLDMPSDFSMAEVDQTSIRRVLQNLLDNAIKFSESGKEVTVKAWSAGDKIHIAVKDCGPGISQEDSGKLFQRCFQGAAGKESNRGMGLGLYLCKQIVDAHKGEIKCISAENAGSTFTVSLPASPLLETTI